MTIINCLSRWPIYELHDPASPIWFGPVKCNAKSFHRTGIPPRRAPNHVTMCFLDQIDILMLSKIYPDPDQHLQVVNTFPRKASYDRVSNLHIALPPIKLQFLHACMYKAALGYGLWHYGVLRGSGVWFMALRSSAWIWGMVYGITGFCVDLGYGLWHYGVLRGSGVWFMALRSSAWIWGMVYGFTEFCVDLGYGLWHYRVLRGSGVWFMALRSSAWIWGLGWVSVLNYSQHPT